MKKYNFYPHSGSGNHGCEAIVRSTINLFPHNDITVFTNHPEEDLKYMPDCAGTFKVATSEIKRYSIRHLSSLMKKYLLLQKNAFDKETFCPLLQSCEKDSLFFSVGGDLYCYETPDYIYRTNRYIREKGCKTILWGCSVDASYIDDAMEMDLKQYDLICARESITYDALKKINPHTILTIDPAFTLKMTEAELPSKHYVGINLSPMIMEREMISGITLKNYCCLVDYILKNTTYDVALIPHVVWDVTDDRKALAQLYECYRGEERVIQVSDHNCMEQKYIISHCDVFVGARTHATIAAYSTCVPTLVVGYSVKARGIAKDLFDDIKHYVLPVQSLKEPEDLSAAFAWINDHKDDIRMHLERVMPEYKKRMQVAIEAVHKLEGPK